MGFYPRLRHKSRFFYPFPERAAALLKKFKFPSLGMKSHKAVGSKKDPVMLNDTIDTNGIAIYPHQDLQILSAVSSKNRLCSVYRL